jgi:hypothetical protein
MDKQTIHTLLQQNHAAFIQMIASLNEATFCKVMAEKWTAGQQAQHIHQSLAPLNKALLLPNFLLGWIFGKSNRPSKTYEALTDKYKSKLQLGGRATGRFVPAAVAFNQKDGLVKQLEKDVATLCKLVKRKSEADLDKYILPHPLLGKLTLRELFYFTAYHVQHHQQLVEQIISN